jgi:hypothetical protein
VVVAARQQTVAERSVGDEADAELTDNGQDRGGDITRPQ